MTLAVAVRFPFGRLRAMASQLPELNVAEAVVLATDSRITLRGNGKIVSDRGRKLFRIANDAGLVYSGDTAAAHGALRQLLRYFRRRAGDAPQEATLQVARILASAHKREVSEHRKGARAAVGPLDVIVGVCSPHTGRADVFFFSSRSGFTPYRILSHNIAAVGSQREAARFEEKLHELEAEQWERYGPPPLDADHWQIIVVAALYSVLERLNGAGLIGGPIQTALLTQQGFFVREFSFLEGKGDPLSLSAWTVTTIAPDETELVPRPSASLRTRPNSFGRASRRTQWTQP